MTTPSKKPKKEPKPPGNGAKQRHDAAKARREAEKIARDARLREIMRELLAAKYGGNIAAFARAVDFSAAYISEIVQAESRGVGFDMLLELAKLTGRSLDSLLGRLPSGQPTFAGLPQWATARTEAERRLAHLRPEVVAAALDRVGRFVAPEPPDAPVVLTGMFVARLAEAVAEKPADY